MGGECTIDGIFMKNFTRNISLAKGKFIHSSLSCKSAGSD